MAGLEDLFMPSAGPTFIQGVVSTGATGPNPPGFPFWYCGVKLNGSSNETIGLRFLKDYWPQVNDIVWVVWWGSDGFVLGRLEDSSTEYKGDNVTVGGQLQVGANQWMSGDGWYRSSGQTGWFSTTYGCGVYMLAADNWVRAYPDGTAGFYAINVRGGAANIGSWGGGFAQFCQYPSIGSSNYGFLHGGGLAALSEQTVSIRQANSARFEMDTAGALHPNIPALTGLGMIYTNTGSIQWGYNASGAKFKTGICDHCGEEDNPIWKIQVRRFWWNEDTVANGAEANAIKPNGHVGLIADEVAEIDDHLVHRMQPTTYESPNGTAGEPTVTLQHQDEGDVVGLDDHQLIAHLIDAVQYLKAHVLASGLSRSAINLRKCL